MSAEVVSLLQTANNVSALYDKWELQKIHVPEDRKKQYDKRLETIVDNTADKDALVTYLGKSLYTFGYGYGELQKRHRLHIGAVAALAIVVVILIIVIIVLATTTTTVGPTTTVERLRAQHARRANVY